MLINWEIIIDLPKDLKDNPYLRYEDTYDHIRQTRLISDIPSATETSKTPNWALVIELCVKNLTISKDLQLMCWLQEAILAQSGLKEFSESFPQTIVFLKQCWDILHPKSKESDTALYEGRLMILESFENAILRHLHLIPIVSLKSETIFPYKYADLIAAYQFERIQERLSPKEQTNPITTFTSAEIWRAISLVNLAFYEEQEKCLQSVSSNLKNIKEFIHEKMIEGPSFKRIFKWIEDYQGFLIEAKKKCIPLENHFEKKTDDGLKEPPGNRDIPKDNGETVQHSTRQEILEQINQLIARLIEVDPYHPVPYLLNRIVHWGAKNTEQLLIEWSDNPQHLQAILDLAGFRKDPSKAS